MYLNGVIMISAILDFGADETDRGNDRPFPLLLPTFAATAWYHHKLPPQYADLKSLLKEVENFSMNDYASALLKGDALNETGKRTRWLINFINIQACQKIISGNRIFVYMWEDSIKSY
jgi:hypothetical protein